eukprot:scaffold60052_cov59-Phaeocystis_antarctica.AAC.13
MMVKSVLTTQTSSSVAPSRSTPTFGGGDDGGRWISGGTGGGIGRFHGNGKGAVSGDSGAGGPMGQR